MPKLDFLTLNYSNTAPTPGNRIAVTMASGVNYQRGIHLQYVELYLGRVYDTVTIPFGERNVTSCQISVVTSGVPWVTIPQSITLDTNTLYAANGYGVSIAPANGPARVELGDIYLPAGTTFTVNAQLYCPGIIATDRVDIHARIAFEYETERLQYEKMFDREKFEIL